MSISAANLTEIFFQLSNEEEARRRAKALAEFTITEDDLRRVREREDKREKKAETDERHAIEEQTVQFSRRLAEAEEATARALEAARARETEAARQLQQVRDRADMTADGRRFYRTEDGRAAYFEDGQRLTQDQLAAGTARAGAPSWETYKTTNAERQQATASREAVQAYSDRLHASRERLQQGGLSADDLRDMENGLDAMPQEVRAQMRQPDPSPAGLTGDFNQAHQGGAAPTPAAAGGPSLPPPAPLQPR